MFVSIHADPEFEYPYYSGARQEQGSGKGLGWNLNIPLPAGTDYSNYEGALLEGIEKIKEKKCTNLVVSFGIDTADGKK